MTQHGGLIAALIVGGGLLILALLSWLERRRIAQQTARQIVAAAVAEAQSKPAPARRIRPDGRDRQLWHLIDAYRATHDITGEDSL